MKKTKFCFLDKVLRVGSETTHCQIVLNEFNSLVVTQKTIELNNLWDYLDGDYICDFSVDDTGALKCGTSVTIQDVNNKHLELLMDRDIIVKPETTNIYNLFIDIVNNGGYFIDDMVIDILGKPEMEKGVSNFLPKFSSTTMTVFMRTKRETGWCTKKLIYEKEGMLTMDSFYFMVNKQYADIFNKYGLEEVGISDYTGVKYVVYKVTDDIGVFAYTSLGLKLYKSLINKYRNLSETDRILIRSAKYLVDMLDDSKEEETTTTKTSTSRYSQYYVKLKPNLRQVSKKELDANFNLIHSTLINLLNCGESASSIVDAFRCECASEEQFISLKYLFATKIYTAAKDPVTMEANILEQCLNDINNYSKEMFKAEVFLYAIRACLFTFDIDESQLNILYDCFIVNKIGNDKEGI